jgi:ABC-type transporter Mla maintaining outer membrane lipid asymmetry ATPase subunit MlaF
MPPGSVSTPRGIDMSSSKPPLVQLRKVTKDYHSLRPLRVEALDLHEGRALALLGFDQLMAEILVDLITAAIVPDSGEVSVFGQVTTSIADRIEWLQTLDRFGLLTERAVLVEQFSVEQNLAIPFSLAVHDLPADVRARVASLATEIGFTASDLAKPVGALPPGGRLRVRLGRALAMGPQVLLAEHPNATLAADEAMTFGTDLRRISKARGLAVLVLTADQDFARAAADEILVLDPATGTLTPSSGWRRWFS